GKERDDLRRNWIKTIDLVVREGRTSTAFGGRRRIIDGRLTGEVALKLGRQRDRRDGGLALARPGGIVAHKEKSLVLAHGAAQNASKLVAMIRRNRLPSGKIVCRVKLVVPQELVQSSMKIVRSEERRVGKE